MPATPKKGRRFGGSSSHQKSMMANLVASLIAAEAITTTEAKAKALRPIAEKMITKFNENNKTKASSNVEKKETKPLKTKKISKK